MVFIYVGKREYGNLVFICFMRILWKNYWFRGLVRKVVEVFKCNEDCLFVVGFLVWMSLYVVRGDIVMFF